eukprot:NODE_243_length_11887_cov_0.520699.p6 type:complete len:230 gc:universal NODE_243_length_11887_cov_0.520699:8150-7461(-)
MLLLLLSALFAFTFTVDIKKTNKEILRFQITDIGGISTQYDKRFVTLAHGGEEVEIPHDFTVSVDDRLKNPVPLTELVTSIAGNAEVGDMIQHSDVGCGVGSQVVKKEGGRFKIVTSMLDKIYKCHFPESTKFDYFFLKWFKNSPNLEFTIKSDRLSFEVKQNSKNDYTYIIRSKNGFEQRLSSSYSDLRTELNKEFQAGMALSVSVNEYTTFKVINDGDFINDLLDMM